MGGRRGRSFRQDHPGYVAVFEEAQLGLLEVAWSGLRFGEGRLGSPATGQDRRGWHTNGTRVLSLRPPAVRWTSGS
jgi:hypothetical protein